jgi:hypothetical protein
MPRGDNDYVTEFYSRLGRKRTRATCASVRIGQVDDCRKTRIEIGEGPNTGPCIVLAPTRRTLARRALEGATAMCTWVNESHLKKP